MSTCPSNLVKECNNKDQLKYIYYHNNKRPIFLKSILVIITAVFLNIKPSIPYNIYCALVITGSILAFNSIKIFHQKSISVNKDLGIEVQEISGLLHNNVQHRFISSEQVIDVVINEGAYGLQFIFYLAIIVKDLDKLVLVFPETDLRLSDLEKLRAKIREKIFDEVEK